MRDSGDQQRALRDTTLSRRDIVLLMGRAVGVTVGAALLAACGTAGNTATAIGPPTTAAVTAGATRQASPATRSSAATAPMSATTVATAPLAHPSGVSSTVAASRVPATPGPVEVQIVDFAFVPATLTVPMGTTVIWTNTGVEHTTTSRDNVWGSEVLERGDTFTFTFTQPGTYPYLCGLHPDMVAVVIVR